MICPKCGNQIGDTVKFCPLCGAAAALTETVEDTGEVITVEAADPEAPEILLEGVAAVEPDPGAEGTGPSSQENTFTEAGTDDTEEASEPQEKTGTNGFAIASIIAAIVAVPCNYIFLIPSILAIIFGIIGITKASAAGRGRGLSIAGLIIGNIAALLWIALFAGSIAFLGVVIAIMGF